MKVALCISGDLRYFRECYPNLKQYLLDIWSPDVFVYGSKPKDVGASDISELYDAKGVVLEEYYKQDWLDRFDDIVDPGSKHILKPYVNGLIMYYMVHKCNELRKKFGGYDRVIRLRSDILLNDRIPDFCFYDDSCLWHSGLMIDPVFQVSDKFLVGKPSLMNRFAGIWNHIEDYWSLIWSVDDKYLPVGERLAYIHLKRGGVPVSCFIMDAVLFGRNGFKHKRTRFANQMRSLFNGSNGLKSFYNNFIPDSFSNLLPVDVGNLSGFKCPSGNGGDGPSFFGVGYPKCGTTWLYSMICEHPGVCGNSVGKEVTFFPHHLYHDIPKSDLDSYNGCFDGGVSGDFSPGYIFHPFVLRQIRENFPGARLIVVLRNPVDAFVSHVNQLYRFRRRYLGLSGGRGHVFDVFSLFPESAYTFSYSKHLLYLLKLFPMENILFLQYEQLCRYPVRSIQRVYSFIGVDGSFIPGVVGRSVHRSKYVFDKPSFDERCRIADFFEDDVRIVSMVVDDFDMSLWEDFNLC